MRILVTGAYGFIGSHIVAALRSGGHEVIGAVRRPARGDPEARFPALACDLARDTHVADWLPRLKGIDAVVNAAGVLRETRDRSFAAVHLAAPRALFEACARTGVRKVVQISALGDPRDGGFIASKHALDAHLAMLDLDWVILRPSVVYSAAGSYGGTSLLRALAALPFVLLLPGDGRQRLQPIAAADLARAVTRFVETDRADRRILEATGASVLTLEDYLVAFRRWLGFGNARVLRVPLALIRPFAWLGEQAGRGPLGLTMFHMLQRGNVAGPGAAEAFAAAAGFQPRTLAEELAVTPSHVQDRWHARLYPLAPLLRLAFAFLWIVSGIAGFATPLDESLVLLGHAGIPAAAGKVLVFAASGVDLAVGLLALTRRARLAAALMVLSLVAYTLFLGFALPALWLEPFGALAKNVALIPAAMVLWVLTDRR